MGNNTVCAFSSLAPAAIVVLRKKVQDKILHLSGVYQMGNAVA